jgi:paired amphipathic helix protein Sin3a
MTHYVNWLHPTRGIDQSLLKPSFLKRNLNQDNNSAFVRSKLRYKIQQESYHMYYIVGSEDAFYRPSSSSNQQETTYNRWHELITMNE